MGKNLIQQRRGRGTHTYKSPSHRFLGEVKLPSEMQEGKVTALLHCAGHTTPLLEIASPAGSTLAFAPEGIKVGDTIGTTELTLGSVFALRDIPEGTLIHNIEIRPGDGGRLARSSGTAARVVAKTENSVLVQLPSRKEKSFLPECRAAIGTLAGSGRLEKPFLKAGTRMKKMWARNKLYPRVCGVSMNAVDHPFGGKSSHIKGRPTQSPRSAPPGRKVGKIAPRRTGRRR